MQIPSCTAEIKQTLTLESGLKLAFLTPAKVSKNTGKAAISVAISQGHFSCEAYPEGFAHLFEHMLFTASSRYRNTNALDQHLLQYHGQVNGWTEDLSTTIQLNCEQAGVLTAFDILLDRLVAPLFTEQDIQREVIAIEAEFQAKKKDSVRQLLSVQKASSNPKHPFSRFHVGNAQTLSQISIKETQHLLYQYHRQVMQGQNMCICVGLVDSDSDNISSAIIKMLAQSTGCLPSAENHSLAATGNHSKVFLPHQLGQLLSIYHKHGNHRLLLSYIIDANTYDGFAGSKSALYTILCHLLESKHEQGLFSHLHQMGWVNDIHSYHKTIDLNNDELVISIELSQHGATKPSDVFAYIQSFIRYLQTTGIETWRFRETANQINLSKYNKQQNSLLEDCIHVSHNMQNESAKFDDVLQERSITSQGSFSVDHAPQAMLRLLAMLQPTQVRLYFLSNLAKTNCITPYYNTRFQIEPLRTLSPKALSISFAKPRQNPFMANQYPMIRAQLPPTQLVHLKAKHHNFKFYQDIRLKLPNGECYVSITDPEMFKTTKQIAIKRVWLSCLNEHLANQFFDVELAHLHFRVYSHSHGISLHTGGLSERQLLLCIELINAIRHFSPSKDAIKRHLQAHVLRIQHVPKQRPLNQLFGELNQYYQAPDKHQNAIHQALLMLTPSMIMTQQQHYFVHNYLESLLIGNWLLASAERFFEQLNDRFTNLKGLSKPKSIAPFIKSGEHLHKQMKTQETHYIWHYIPLINNAEVAAVSQHLKLTLAARSLVLEKIMSQVLFDVIRQKHKMGYTHGIGYKPISSFPGLAIYVVSSTHSAQQIHSASLEVIETTIELIESGKVVLSHVTDELIRQVTPQERDISQTASRAWLHFEDDNPILGYEDLISALQALQMKEILAALSTLQKDETGQVLLTLASEPVDNITETTRVLPKNTLKYAVK